MTLTIIVLVVLAVVLWGFYVSWRASRLDRPKPLRTKAIHVSCPHNSGTGSVDSRYGARKANVQP